MVNVVSRLYEAFLDTSCRDYANIQITKSKYKPSQPLAVKPLANKKNLRKMKELVSDLGHQKEEWDGGPRGAEGGCANSVFCEMKKKHGL